MHKRILTIAASFLFTNASLAAGIYDAEYQDGVLKIPLISVDGRFYEATLVADKGVEASKLGCDGVCLRLVSAKEIKDFSTSTYSVYDAPAAVVKIINIWHENRIYDATLKYKGQFLGSSYFQLASAEEKKNVFNTTPIMIRDPVAHHRAACKSTANAADNPGLQYLIPINLNNDQYIDFIAHYWCSLKPELWGTEQTSRTPDALVAFVSDSNGEYRVDNDNVFGDQYVSLGGGSRKYAIGDINSDGIDDIAFAMHWEDGRLGGTNEQKLANSTEPSVLLSNGLGKYEIVRLGGKAWGHSVGLVKREQGNYDVVFVGWAGADIQAFRWENHQLVDVTDEYPKLDEGSTHWANTFLALPAEKLGQAENMIFGHIGKQGSSGVAIWKKENDAWSIISESLFPSPHRVDFVNWNGSESKEDVFDVDGMQFLGGSFIDACLVKNEIGSDEYLIAALFGSRTVQGGIDFSKKYKSGDTTSASIIFVYKVLNGRLERVNNAITQDDTATNSFYLSCNDVNGDGRGDLTNRFFSNWWEVYDIGGIPFLYLGQEYGKYAKLNTNGFPTLRNGHSQGMFLDVNQDGLNDLILFPQGHFPYGNETDSLKNNIYIYLADQKLHP